MSRTEDVERGSEEATHSDYLQELDDRRGPEILGPSDGPLETPYKAPKNKTSVIIVQIRIRVFETAIRRL